MTITEHAPVIKAEAAPVSTWRRWLAPATFAVFGLVDIFVFGLFAHAGDVTFAFSPPFAKVTIPNLSLPAARGRSALPRPGAPPAPASARRTRSRSRRRAARGSVS